MNFGMSMFLAVVLFECDCVLSPPVKYLMDVKLFLSHSNPLKAFIVIEVYAIDLEPETS